MYPGGYTVEVACLSLKATEKDVYDFFIHCGSIEHVQIFRSDEDYSTAHVTFNDAYAMEVAILLSGETLLDQTIYISRQSAYVDESVPWDATSRMGENTLTDTRASQFVSTPGEAVTMAQEVVTTMLSKGYVLGKDCLIKAKAFDDSHRVSATAAAKVAEVSSRIGLTDKIYAGVGAAKSVDEKLHVSEITKSAATVTGRAAMVTGRGAAAAASSFVNSSYFAKGALWVSDVLTGAAKVAADLGARGNNQSQGTN